MKKPKTYEQRIETKQQKTADNPMGGIADVFSGLMKGIEGFSGGGTSKESGPKPVESQINGRFCLSTKGFKNLRRLDLKYNTKVTDKDLKGLSDMKELESIDLSGTKVTGAFLKYLKKHPNLKELILIDCRYLTDNALKHMSNLTGLERVIIARAEITGTAFRGWECLKNLREIRLLGCTKLLDRNLKNLSAVENLEHLVITALS